jgi:hypothetical protein
MTLGSGFEEAELLELARRWSRKTPVGPRPARSGWPGYPANRSDVSDGEDILLERASERARNRC